MAGGEQVSTEIQEGGPNGLDAQVCRGDFWLKLEEAMKQAHGNPDLERLRKMTLEEACNLLAQNGIRMTFKEEWHINPQHLNTK
jgi:hypothetical protein